MRGDDQQQGAVFSYINPEQRIPQDHPLRAIRRMTEEGLRSLDLHFEALYARRGRPSIAPEKLVRALLLMVLYSIRGERQLMEQLNYNLLFRWFVGLNPDDKVWDATVFTKNRERLMQGQVSERLLEAVVEQAGQQQLLSEEHFTVDGTLIRAWASRRSFVAKPEPPAKGSGHGGKKLLRDTHESQSDPQARLYKRSEAAQAVPSYMGHVLIENRHGLVVKACATQSSTTAEREACLQMLEAMGPAGHAITLGGDTLYQEPPFLEKLRARNVLPHVAEYQSGNLQKNSLRPEERGDSRFAISQRKRKLVERVFGWGKLDRALQQVKLRGEDKVDWLFRLVAIAYNLTRMVRLIPAW